MLDRYRMRCPVIVAHVAPLFGRIASQISLRRLIALARCTALSLDAVVMIAASPAPRRGAAGSGCTGLLRTLAGLSDPHRLIEIGRVIAA